jgi:hypothetical protein
MQSFSVSLEMDQATVDALQAGSYRLYVLRAVQVAGGGGGGPVVWVQTANYSLSTTLSWGERFQAYTSLGPITGGGRVLAAASYDIDPGQTLNVRTPAGTGFVQATGVAGAISITNETNRVLVCGISAPLGDGTFTPLCALPLFPLTKQVIVPLQQVFLAFPTPGAAAGTVLFQVDVPGILIDLAGAGERTVRYDGPAGGAWEPDAPWARMVAPDTDLAPLLIEPALG